MKKSLDDLLKIAYNTFALIERDPSIQSVLREPHRYSAIERVRTMEDKFTVLDNSFFLLSPKMFYTVIDLHGNIYTSYAPRESLNYDKVRRSEHFDRVLSGKETRIWVNSEQSSVHFDYTRSKDLASLYIVIYDDYKQPLGAARISIDYLEWFNTFLRGASDQSYFIVNEKGNIIAQSNPNSSPVEPEMLIPEEGVGKFYIDRERKRVINYTYYAQLDWFLINEIPLSDLFLEVDWIKKRYLLVYLIVTLVFIVVTILISTTLTRPIRHMQRKMSEVVAKHLKTRIPENLGSKEMNELAGTFNQMLVDMNELIERLKMEERQKEAIRFQLLQMQMNPHFLLNTINTIKSLALQERHRETHDICLSLGKLLEAGLTMDREMVYLKDEIELVKAFAHIHNARFQDGVTLLIEYSPDLDYALVPKLSLQPLVENCYRHAFRPADPDKIIRMRGFVQNQSLILEVEDNGRLRSGDNVPPPERKGIGIKNVRERLRILFKQDADIELIEKEEGMLARLRIPLLLSIPYGIRVGD